MQELVLMIEKIETSKTDERFRGLLAARVSELMMKDIAGLVHLLYRIDIPEKKLLAATEGYSQEEKAMIIADLIIERQIQKAKLREQYRDDREVSGEEKW